MERQIKSIGILALTAISITVIFNGSSPRPALKKIEVLYRGGGVPISSLLDKKKTILAKKKRKNRAIASVVGDEAPPRELPNQVLEIPKGEIVYLDRGIHVGTLVVNGELHCVPSSKGRNPAVIEIKTGSIEVNGIFQCGTPEEPYLEKFIISLKGTHKDPVTHPDYRGIMVNPGGRMVLTGRKGKEGWVRLKKTVEAGERELILDSRVDDVSNRYWSIGDEIALAPTSYDANEAEKFTITEVHGNVLKIDHPVQYRHWGEIQILPQSNPIRKFISYIENHKSALLDQRAEVANLTRNILIRADESEAQILETPIVGAEVGGHIMVMAGGAAYIDNVELFKMGQAGILGRYPFHWHMAGNVDRQYIKNSSIHHSYQRCITVHRTDFADVINNTCFDFKGHGFFLEDGTEKNNRIVHNLGILAKYPYRSKSLLASDMTSSGSSPMGEYQGRFPNVSIFWLSHPYNDIRENVAAGSVGTGFWMGFHDTVTENDGTVLYPSRTNTLNFSDNSAHSTLVGFTWDGGPNGVSTGNPRNSNDRSNTSTVYQPTEVPVFRRLTAFKNAYTGIYFRGIGGVFENALTADNGWHFWLAFNQVVRNSVMVGRSINHSEYDQGVLDTNLSKPYIQVSSRRTQQSGIVLYDGPFELDGIDFLNYPTGLVFRQSDSVDITPVPVGIAGGTEAFMNISRRTRFFPNPILRMVVPDYTNAALFRDLDGSFIEGSRGVSLGPGAVLVGRRSVGIPREDYCKNNLETYRNLAVCPPEYHESSLNIFDGDYVWGVNGEQYGFGIWSQPFVAQKSNGSVTNPMSQWPNIFFYGTPWTANGTKFGIPNHPSETIDLILKRHHPSVWVNSEIERPPVPVVRVVGHGKNCRLVAKDSWDPPPNISNSMSDLRSAQNSAYYSSNEEFYVKLIPDRFAFVVNAQSSVRSFTSGHYYVECDQTVDPVIMGEIESFEPVQSGVKGSYVLRGFACHFGLGKKIRVDLSLEGSRDEFRPSSVLSVIANLSSNSATSFKCGTGGKDFAFEFVLPPLFIKQNESKLIYVKGRSSLSGVTDSFLNGSGKFKIPFVGR